MFAPIAAFEWRYQLRSPVFWVGCLLFFLLTFGATTVDQIQIGSLGNVNRNSPFAIVQTLAVMSLFAVFVHIAMVAGAVIRDDETGFAPLLRSTRIGKTEYLLGRFAGAAGAAFVVLAMMPLAVAVGSLMPWLDAEKLGPFVAAHYVYALLLFALPTMLVVAAAVFALATLTRSMMWCYVGAVALLVGYFVTRGLLRDPQYDLLAGLLDPFGVSALNISTRYWTAAERNALMPPVFGLVGANRALWLAVAAALLALAWRRFRFADGGRADMPAKPSAATADRSAPAPALATAAGRLPKPRADAGTARAQLWALTRHDMGFVFRSPAFFVLLAIGMLNAGAAAWYSGEWYGSGSWPVTRLMVQALEGAFTIMPIIIAVYYGGELVWRDRERRLSEIVDATAAPDWAHLLPKVAAIAGVLAATNAVAVLTGMGVQLAKGYTVLEPGRYLLWFWWPTLIGALQLAVLSIFVQVLAPQKFIGWGLMLLHIVAVVAFSVAGFEHSLYLYGEGSPVPLSDMNGMGRFWVGASWFQLYWSAFALLLAMLAYAGWRRGSNTSLRARLPQLRRRLRGAAAWLTVLALGVWAGSGAWIFHNTNRLNRYLPAPEAERLLAEAEKALLPLDTLPLPRITAVTLDVQLYPREARAVTRGSYQVENHSGAAIDQLLVSWSPRLVVDVLEMAGARTVQTWGPAGAEWPVRRLRLDPPLQAGEVREMRFQTTLHERGFPNSSPLTGIVANGSFVNNSEITPSLGVPRREFLTDRAKRRKHGLPPDLRPPTLEDERGRGRSYIRADSDWVLADITVGTDADQTAIAPGQTLSDTVTGGRRQVHFRPETPINHFFSIQSARYDVARERLGDIELAVYHQPGHEFNVPRMLKAMKASLALFSEQFSPYQFKQARIIEFPAYQDFAQAFANTIPYSESIGFIARLTDSEKIDQVTYITAHEIAHQWWAHQLMPSEQQGATMLVESLAQYSALLVMERLYGPEQLRRFLKYELDRYLRARGGEVVEELPLARVENQPYIHYAKGTLAMVWLKEVLGEAKLNAVLAELLKRHAMRAAPYPNTLDLLHLLRQAAGPAQQELISDLFEKITLWDFKVLAAAARPRPDGRWDLQLDIEAHKFHADGQGRQTEAPLAETVEIGVFAAEPGRAGFDARSVLLMQRQAVVSGRQSLHLVLDQQPLWAGVDPYHKRIDRRTDDNLLRVSRD